MALLYMGLASIAIGFAEETGVNHASLQTVSPYYFGPNAFPVPDIAEKTISDLKVGIFGEYFRGKRNDNTYDLLLRADIPLFTPRVNLSLWWQLMEWYATTTEFLDACNISQPYREKALKGHRSGDIYVATVIQILEEGKYRPGWTVRATLKTASGGGFNEHRFYDSPGYFFDTAVGKKFKLDSEFPLWIDCALSTGFLCWQSAQATQNDAVMFGMKLGIGYGPCYIGSEFGGYSGWQHSERHTGSMAHDQPMRVRLCLAYKIRDFNLEAGFLTGVHDYPYSALKFGLAYYFNILKPNKL